MAIKFRRRKLNDERRAYIDSLTVDRDSIVAAWNPRPKHWDLSAVARRERAEERTESAKNGSYFRHEVMRRLLNKGRAEQQEYDRYRRVWADFTATIKTGWGIGDGAEAEGVRGDEPGEETRNSQYGWTRRSPQGVGI